MPECSPCIVLIAVPFPVVNIGPLPLLPRLMLPVLLGRLRPFQPSTRFLLTDGL